MTASCVEGISSEADSPMSKTPVSSKSGKPRLTSPVLVVCGIAVVVAGLLVPQLLPSTVVPHTTLAVPSGSVEGDLTYQPPTWPEGPDVRSLLVRLLGGTAAVLVLCVVVLRCSRGWMSSAAQAGPGESSISLLETYSLGNRCILQLVKVGKRQVLVGRDHTGLKSVIPLPDPFESVLADLQSGESDPAGVSVVAAGWEDGSAQTQDRGKDGRHS